MTAITQQTQIKPDQIIEIILRYRWLIICFMAVSLTLGVAKTLTSDRTYEASTLILVQPQKVPTNYVRSVVSTGIEARISTISQQIMSRSNLEKIIDQFGLFAGKEDMYLEDKIEGLRSRINVKIDRVRHGSETFTVRFVGSEPERVMQITNTLASYFMEENLRVREAQAVGTSEFLEAELEKTRERLEEKESRLSEYRAKYLGGLPDELEANLRTLDRLQAQLTNKQDALRDERNAMATLQTRISQHKELLAQNARMNEEENRLSRADNLPESERERLEALKKNLDMLLLKYTEKHPDVMKLQNTIEKLSAKIKNNPEKPGKKDVSIPAYGYHAPSGQDMFEYSGQYSRDPDIRKLQMQLEDTRKNIAGIEEDMRRIENKMEIYQQRVEDTPKREQELQKLRRDYANIQDVYASLLARKLEAEISVNMEKKQKGEQFRILDHARVPEKPISPDVRKAFGISFGAGGILTGCIIVVLFLFDDAVRRDEDIEDSLDLPILAEIAPIRHFSDQIKEKMKTMVFLLVSLYTVMVIMFFMVLNVKGIDRTLDTIRSYVNI